MGQVTLTAEMRAKLDGLKERVELRDEQGNLIGYFEPPPKPAPPAAEAWGPFTAEEVAEAFRRTGRVRTLDEIYREYGHL